MPNSAAILQVGQGGPVFTLMSTKKLRSPEPAKVDTLPSDYKAPGAMTRQQREERLEGLIQVFADIFAGLTSEQLSRYTSEPAGQEAA
jgi:hypothetical protein